MNSQFPNALQCLSIVAVYNTMCSELINALVLNFIVSFDNVN